MTNTDKTKLIDFLISYKINDPISIRIYKRKQNELIDITSIVNITEKIEINMKRYLNLIQEVNLETKKQINLETKKTDKFRNKKTYTEHFNLLYKNDTYIVIEYKQVIQSDELFPNLKSYDYNKDKVIKIKEKINYKIIKDEIMESGKIILEETNDPRSYRVDSSKIRSHLNFTPKFGVKEAVLDLKMNFESFNSENPLQDSKYVNILKMKELNLG